jgi:predicted RNase H-like HicB family nuclease
LYNTTNNCFENISEVLKLVFNGTIKDSEIDMNDFLTSFEKIKI